MRTLIAAILLVNTFQCGKPKSNIQCNKNFFECATTCSTICKRTIDYDYEYGKCFGECITPCRKDYCIEARMVEVVDTEDLKSFANIRRGGSSPSASSILKRR